MDDFIQKYYGPAAPYIAEYYRTYETAYLKSRQQFALWSWSPLEDCRFLSLDTMLKLHDCMVRAEKAVGNQEPYAVRVLRTRIPVWYVFLLRFSEFEQEAKTRNLKFPYSSGMKGLYEKFNASLPRAGILQFTEGPRSWWPTVGEIAMRDDRPQPPPGYETLKPSRWCALPPLHFTADRSPRERLFVDDSFAAGRKALKITPELHAVKYSRPMWNIPINTLAREWKKKPHLLLSVRCDRKGKEGDAFRCGVNFRSNRLTVKCSEITSNGYRIYDLGPVESPADWTHVWISCANNPDNVNAVFLGGLWVVIPEEETR